MIISGERHESYASLAQRIAKAAGGFASLGAGPGANVGVMLRNDIAYFEAVQGVTGAGASVVPVNWHMKAAEVAYILQDSAARALVVHADLLPQIAEGIPTSLPVLVVPTPPEVAGAYGIATAELPTGLSTTGWNTWVEAQAPFAARSSAAAR